MSPIIIFIVILFIVAFIYERAQEVKREHIEEAEERGDFEEVERLEDMSEDEAVEEFEDEID